MVRSLTRKRFRPALLVGAAVLGLLQAAPGEALSQGPDQVQAESAPLGAPAVPRQRVPRLSEVMGSTPASLQDLTDIPLGREPGDEPQKLNLDLKERRSAALSYGIRGGLAWRTHQIAQHLDGQSGNLDRIWNFNSLAIAVPGGSVVVVPPVVTRADNSMAVAQDGKSATSIDRRLLIVQDARISAIAPNWRDYLYRVWDSPAELDPFHLPRSDEERKGWQAAVREGWSLGIQQADQIFELDLNRLKRDFEGMVRFRELVARGLVRDIYLAATDLGVTGGGRSLNIGDRAVRITAAAQLDADEGRWRSYVLPEGLTGEIQ